MKVSFFASFIIVLGVLLLHVRWYLPLLLFVIISWHDSTCPLTRLYIWCPLLLHVNILLGR